MYLYPPFYPPFYFNGVINLLRAHALARRYRICGLLSQSHDNEDLRPRTQGPEPSTAHLGPRALSAGVVDSLEEGFVLHKMGFGGRMVYQE